MRCFSASVGALLFVFLMAADAAASCGSSSCPLDLHALQDMDTRGFSLDLSFQFIDQDQPRIGSRRARIGEIPSDHDEIRTINRLATLQLGYGINSRLQLGLTLPYVSRSHEHFETASAEIERWNFSDPGDAALQARWRLFRSDGMAHSSVWLNGGVKFATGSTHETGSNGEEAEVTIAPGTGSTDALVGATLQSGFLRDTSLQGEIGHTTVIPFFVAINGRMSGRGTHGYRRGNEMQLNAGIEYPFTEAVHVLAQVNSRFLAKDDVGTTGEDRDLTGGRSVYLSPGARFLIGERTSVYGFVQVPVYQYVNGLQLTSKLNYLAGVHRRF